MRLKDFYRSPTNVKHLLWALPLALFILAIKWWFEASLWSSGEFDRPSNSWAVPMFYRGAIETFVMSGLLAVIPILAANWSRTIWPRIALAMFLLVAQVVSGFIYIVAPR